MNDAKERALAHYDDMKAAGQSHTGMQLKIGDLVVEYEWHPKTETKDIHTVVKVPEGNITFELEGNWHAPFIIVLAVKAYLQALSRQLLSSEPIDAFKLGNMHGLIWGGKAKQEVLEPAERTSDCCGKPVEWRGIRLRCTGCGQIQGKVP